MAKFSPLFSSSAGNCIYISSASSAILIDAGRSARQIETALRDNSLSTDNIRGIFVTHEHIDHIKGVRVLAKRLGIPVYSSEKTLNSLCSLDPAISSEVRLIEVGREGVECADMFIKPFKTSHDAIDSCGYTVCTADNRRVGICTDLGYVSDEVESALLGSDLVLIESNHDVRMLENGSYPYALKRRVLSERGHLSNDDCARQVGKLLNGGTTRFFLGHLSRENNVPELAYQTSKSVLTQLGAVCDYDYTLCVAPRDNNGKVVLF